MHQESWVDNEILRFALLSCHHAVGAEAVVKWLQASPPQTGEEAEISSSASGPSQHEDHLEEVEEGLPDGGNAHPESPECRFSRLYILSTDSAPQPNAELEEHFPSAYQAHQEDMHEHPETQEGDEPAESLEGRIKRTFHLLSQLCLTQIDLLALYAEMFGVAMASYPTEENPICEHVKADLQNLLPALLHSSRSASNGTAMDVEIFRTLASVARGPVKSLLLFALQLLVPESVTPPKSALLAEVHRYLLQEDEGLRQHIANMAAAAAAAAASAAAEAAASTAMEVEEEPSEEQTETPSAAPAITTSAAPAQPTSSSTPTWSITQLTDDLHVKLALTVAGGLPSSVLEEALPRVLTVYGENPDGLRSVFTRITKCRPPAMTKANLLTALHRIPSDSVKAKLVLDAIALCLNNKAEYSGEVIRDCLRNLCADAVPVFALMRTAILASNTFAEIKKMVLVEVIPALIENRVWQSASKVWEGVLYYMKTITASKQLETSLLALCAIPGVQLKALFKVAPAAKGLMAKLLQGLSVEERDQRLDKMADHRGDAEKAKIVKELLAMPPPAAP